MSNSNVPSVTEARSGSTPIIGSELVDDKPDDVSPSLCIQFLLGEGDQESNVLTINDGGVFPQNIFARKTDRLANTNFHYYLDYADGVESQPFDRIIVKCEHGLINSIRFKLISTTETWDTNVIITDNDLIEYVNASSVGYMINGEREVGPAIERLKISYEGNGTICDITEKVTDIFPMVYIDGQKYPIGPKVPSNKRCTIKITASRGSKLVRLVSENNRYIVWKRLISSCEIGNNFRYGNLSSRPMEKLLAHYYGVRNLNLQQAEPDDTERDSIIRGAHLFYYKFSNPNAENASDRRSISFHNGNVEYLRIARPKQAINFLNRNCEVLSTAEAYYRDVISRIGNTTVAIRYSIPTIGIFEWKYFNLRDYVTSVDGGWNDRFQNDRQFISAHSYGLAVDINAQNLFNDMRVGAWNQQYTYSNGTTYVGIIDVLRNLTYERCEESITNGTVTERKFFFTCNCRAEDYVNGELININNRLDAFMIRNGKALENWFLYHLAFKYRGFFWGGHFMNNGPVYATDAMHYSLVETRPVFGVPDNAYQEDSALPSYPPLTDDQHRTEYYDSVGTNRIPLFSAYHRLGRAIPVLAPPYRYNYDFLGWKDISNPSKNYGKGDSVSPGNSKILRLEAKWFYNPPPALKGY